MAEKMFIRVKQKAKFTSELLSKYMDSIVFIEDKQEIWSNGVTYAIPETWQGKITSLESAVLALESVNAFTSISDGKNTGSATSTAKTIRFTGTGATTVTVSEQGVTINSTDFTDDIADAKKAGTDANTALETYKTSNNAAVEAAKAQADKGVADAAAALEEALAKVASVKSGSNGIAINGTATEPTVALKLDNSGNVKFSESGAGLKATVEIEQVTVPVTGVKEGEKIIDVADTKLFSTLKLNYNSTSKKLQLLGKEDAVVHEIDATAFVKDGMISDIEYDQDTHTLSITFNTDAGDVTIDDIDLSDLVDIYEEGNGILFTDGTEGKKVNVQKDPASEDFLSVSASGVKISGVNKAISDAKEAIEKYTVNGTPINQNPVVTGANTNLTGYDKGSDAGAIATSDSVNAAFGKIENRLEAVKATADAALTDVTVINGTYVTVTPGKTGTTKTLTINDSAIADLFSWEEIN